MNGIHDLGGMHGFGPVVPKADEPVFHEAWEGLVFAIVQTTRGLGLYNVDEFRHAIERMEPVHYLEASYYERWLTSAETNLIEKGIVTRREIDERMGLLRARPETPSPIRENPDVRTRARAGQPHDWPPRFDSRGQRFAVGDAVTVRNLNPAGHTRVPRYVRGKRGVVAAVRGLQSLPDARAHGQDAPPESVYSVRFDARELWGDAADAAQTLSIDLWESYLEE